MKQIVEKDQADIFGELEFSDAGVKIELIQVEKVNKAMCPHCTKDVIKMLYLVPNGLVHKSMAIPGLTYASMNLGKVRVENGVVKASYCTRSPLLSMREEMSNQVSEIVEMCSGKSWCENDFGGWAYVENSPLRELLKEILQEQGLELKTNATHGGLETGIFKAILPELDIITYGPKSSGAHTPDEKLDLESFKRAYRNLTALLSKI